MRWTILQKFGMQPSHFKPADLPLLRSNRARLNGGLTEIRSIRAALHQPPRRPRVVLGMTRRIDFITAEKISIALLTRAAFGTDAGVRNALFSGLDAGLVSSVFARDRDQIRKDVQGVNVLPDRRLIKRDPDQ